MSKDALSLLFIELRKKLHEIDWINTPYLQTMMDTKDEWLKYQEELKAIPHKLTMGLIDPPRIVNGALHFDGWPPTPSDYGSAWDRMGSFSKRNNE